MELTVLIPDDLAAKLSGGDLSRRALEGFALEELRAGRITEPELRKMLGPGRIDLDGFPKTRGIYQDCSIEEFEQEQRALREGGL